MTPREVNPLLLALHRQQEQRWKDREAKKAAAEGREVKQVNVINGNK
jgi:hypothetical protein